MKLLKYIFAFLLLSISFVNYSFASGTLGICPGISPTLTWSSSNASSCTSAVTSGNFACGIPASTSGTQQITSPTSGCSVSYTCQNSVGTSASDSATLSIYSGAALGANGCCGVGTNLTKTYFNSTTNTCELPVTATFTALPSNISYNSSATLTWTSTYASSTVVTGNWSNLTPPTGNQFNGSGSTGALTENQVYTFRAIGPGGTSPLITRNVTVCSQTTPIWNGATCEAIPEIDGVKTVVLKGQYTRGGFLQIDVAGANVCKVMKGVTLMQTLGSVDGPVGIHDTYDFNENGGAYSVVCSYDIHDGNHKLVSYPVFTSITYNYQPTPPSPIVSLKQSPATITKGSATVISWNVLYPISNCNLTATAVCATGGCTADQNAERVRIMDVISTGDIDTNTGVPLLPRTAQQNKIVNAVKTIPGYDTNVDDGVTDWKAFGKKTFILNSSMDFLLDCQSGTQAGKQKVRVLVTSSNEG